MKPRKIHTAEFKPKLAVPGAGKLFAGWPAGWVLVATCSTAGGLRDSRCHEGRLQMGIRVQNNVANGSVASYWRRSTGGEFLEGQENGQQDERECRDE